MKKLVRNICELLTLFLFFGGLYFLLESAWKQHFTDWRMFVLAGIIGTVIGLYNNIFTYETDFLCQCIVGGMQFALLCECVFGYYWNIELGLNLWNYSNPPLSYLSFCANQVNVLFAVIWIFLSAIAIILADIIHYYIFRGDGGRPYYKVFGRLVFTMSERRQK